MRIHRVDELSGNSSGKEWRGKDCPEEEGPKDDPPEKKKKVPLPPTKIRRRKDYDVETPKQPYNPDKIKKAPFPRLQVRPHGNTTSCILIWGA